MPITARPTAPMAAPAMRGLDVGARASEVPVAEAADSDALEEASLAEDMAPLAVWERVAAALLWLAIAFVIEERTPESELATAPVAVESSELAAQGEPGSCQGLTQGYLPASRASEAEDWAA